MLGLKLNHVSKRGPWNVQQLKSRSKRQRSLVYGVWLWFGYIPKSKIPVLGDKMSTCVELWQGRTVYPMNCVLVLWLSILRIHRIYDFEHLIILAILSAFVLWYRCRGVCMCLRNHNANTGWQSHIHYNDALMSEMASHITSVPIVYSTICCRRRSKKTSRLHVTDLCAGNSPVTGEFAAQWASNAENVSIWWVIMH